MRGHPGVGHLALQADVPVITAYVEGAHRAMPRGSVIPRPHRITVHWGEVRSPEEWLSLAEDEGEKQRPSDALVSVLMKDIARLGGQTSDSLAG
jgi:1-acyl-sn-glycerol-3-phosphate acyltransferase